MSGTQLRECVCLCQLVIAAAMLTTHSLSLCVNVFVLSVGTGGWDEPFELELFAQHGFQAVTLGSRVLRSDVAVNSLLALAHSWLDDIADTASSSNSSSSSSDSSDRGDTDSEYSDTNSTDRERAAVTAP
jgi:hypothetical protein